jgi:hypothetical protein
MNGFEGNEHQDDPDRDIEQPPAAVERHNTAVNNTARGNQGNKKKTNWPQRVEAVCAVLLVIITGCYTFYARKQLKAMQGQITEMKNARAQSKLDSASAITAQQAIAQSALSASQTNFDKTSQNSEKTFRNEQRAWIGAIMVTNAVFKEDAIPSYSIIVINSGKTPALHVHSITMNKSRPKGEKIEFDYPPIIGKQINSDMVLQPGAQSSLNNGPSEAGTLSKAQADIVASGDYWWWIYGKMTYQDAFKRTHHTKFCFIMTPDLKYGQPCDTYNEAD